MSLPGLEPAELPADAVEVGRILDAWGVKGWFKIQPYSASPEALFSCKRWFLLPPERPVKTSFAAPTGLTIKQVRDHADTVVASAQEVPDRNVAEQLKGARIFISRASFPVPEEDEFYWVDLLGLAVINREGLTLGTVKDLLATGPQTTLVLSYEFEGKSQERMIPFVKAFVDSVDLQGKLITVDWQPDY